MTVITPGAGCSITSTATVSTTGVTGGFTFRAAFFTATCLGLAVAAVRFVAFPLVDLDTLRALPRVADFLLGIFPRFCTFDAFLRLAMIDPPLVLRNDTTVQVAARYQTRVITRFQLERDRLGAILPRSDWTSLLVATEGWDGGEVCRITSLAGFDSPHDAVQENGTYGGQGKAVGCVPPTALLSEPRTRLS